MRPSFDQTPVICIAENRTACEPSIKLLLISLCRYCKDLTITLFYPNAAQDFLDWAHELGSEKITVRTTAISGAYGWNVKPQALLQLLNEGYQEVLWIDSDILATKDIVPTFSNLNRDVLVVTEEALLGQNELDALRARLWRFPVGRKFPFPLNTSIMRVTQEHVPLLKRWKEILESPSYQHAQQQPMNRRPLHMFSDQDVLTALLSSDEFQAIPIKVLRRGHDIIQYFGHYGFTLEERFTCMVRGMPTFIHQQGFKPWLADPDAKPSGLRDKIKATYRDLSPYTLVAKALDPATIGSWARPRSKVSRALRALGFGYLPLVGLPIAAAFDLERNVNRYFPETSEAVRARRAAKYMRRQFRDTFLVRQT